MQRAEGVYYATLMRSYTNFPRASHYLIPHKMDLPFIVFRQLHPDGLSSLKSDAEAIQALIRRITSHFGDPYRDACLLSLHDAHHALIVRRRGILTGQYAPPFSLSDNDLSLMLPDVANRIGYIRRPQAGPNASSGYGNSRTTSAAITAIPQSISTWLLRLLALG